MICSGERLSLKPVCLARTILLLAPILLLAAPSQAQNVSADAIAAQDRLGVKVLEWLPAKGEYKEWAAVGGEYTVGADGAISVPFAGSIPTAGHSASEVAGLVAKALQHSLSLPTMPDVAIDVLRRGPVYVLGGVETPGKVDFVPGMTAIEAISLSGGFYRGSGGQLRLQRDVINAKGDLDTATQSAARLTVKIARLEAEMVGANDVALAKGRPDFPQAVLDPIVEEEQQLLQVRKKALDSQIESLKSREKLATEQTQTLNEKATNLQRQVKLSQQQLSNIESLVGKGLTVASRQFDLERTVSDFQGQLLDVESARLAASLEINAAQRDQVDAITAFKTEVATSLQDAREALAKARIDIDRAQLLIREATVITPQMLVENAETMGVNVHLFRSRKGADGKVQTTEIDRNDILQSGDTLQVQLDTSMQSGEVAGQVRSGNPT